MEPTVSLLSSNTSDPHDISSFSNVFHADTCSPRNLAHIKRRRAARACLGCRARKVRCNVTENDSPCTNCRLDGLECVVRRRKRAKPQQFRVHCFNQDMSYSNGPTKVIDMVGDHEDVLGDGRDQGTLMATPDLSLDLLGENVPIMTGSFEGNINTLSPLQGADTQGICDLEDTNILNQDLLKPLDFISTTPFPVGVANPSTQEVSSSKLLLPAYIKPLRAQITAEDTVYLQRKGALIVPDLELRNALLQGFIEYVYPYMPILDLKDLGNIICQGDGKNGEISLLLFQAVMFAGSAFVDMKYFSNAGYITRRAARKALFQKVRLLYESGSESCVISQIQSLLLMTYYFKRPNEQKDLWYWIGIVVSLAKSVGLQRDPKTEPTLSTLREQHLRKRLWWSIFMRDQLIAIGMRRLPRIGRDDYNVPPLALDDFECDADLAQLCILVPSCMVARDVFQRRQLAVMCMQQAKLSILMGLLLSSRYTISHAGQGKPDLEPSPRNIPSATRQAYLCLQELGAWSSCLPRICVYDSSTALSRCESPVMTVHKAILRMIYLTTLSAVYLPEVLPLCPWSTSTTTLLHPKPTSSIDPAQHVIYRSASEITCIAQDLQTLDLVRFLPTTVVTALLPAMMIHLLEIRSKTSQTTSIMPSFHLFGGCMGVMQKLHEMYASADFAIEFIEETARKANVDVTFVISPQTGITMLSPNANSEIWWDSEDLSFHSSLKRQNWFSRKVKKNAEPDALRDLDRIYKSDGDSQHGDFQEEDRAPSSNTLRTDPETLDFLNLAPADDASGISPKLLLSGSLEDCESQQKSDATKYYNAAQGTEDLVGSTGTGDLDSLNMSDERFSDGQSIVNFSMDKSLYCNGQSGLNFDFDFWGLFATAA
ncbi:fungal-specific transcription factor domain-containing protein [Xylogone sp. PMI_703]|nr:fungal-specific transcription factor domain-containing protein [Xylogone sp. PMI_703]